ncbi:MAG TPA: helix-turn-helix domain-containing protein [Bryobacteraceae bacterium]|nr:helix-turn-helix domain-containing protein [Bryobacteraceae bacterium]
MALYCEEAPGGSLSRWVECAWFLDSAGEVSSHRVPPDGCVDIVYDRGQGLRVIGAMTLEQRFAFPQGTAMAGLRFRPGMARAFLGISPAELTDRSTGLADLLPRGARAIERQLDDAASIRDALRILLGNLAAPESNPDPVQKAIGALTAANGNADLDTLANQANLSPRQFRRRCLEESGLTPKHLARVLRFRHASAIARSSQRLDWVSIALDAGYCDQSHFIRDFREFTGHTPMAVFSNTASAGPA